MTNQEILEKAIQKAIDGGWRPLHKDFEWKVVKRYGVEPYLSVLFAKKDDKPFVNHNVAELRLNVNDIIFNHDFAKALWGEENFMRYDGDTLDPLKTWQWNLQQMVIADDPIKYLGDNIG